MRNIAEFDQFVNESSRQFPGPPQDFYFTMKIAEIGQGLLNKPGGKNRSLGNSLMNIAKISGLAPVSYWNLFQELDKINAELSPWWNKNYKRMGGTPGSGKNLIKNVSHTREETDVDFQDQLEGIDPLYFNHFQALLAMMGDKRAIRPIAKGPVKEEIHMEQVEIFRRILFTLFMCVFKPGYLRKAETIIENIAKQVPRNPNLN